MVIFYDFFFLVLMLEILFWKLIYLLINFVIFLVFFKVKIFIFGDVNSIVVVLGFVNLSFYLKRRIKKDF